MQVHDCSRDLDFDLINIKLKALSLALNSQVYLCSKFLLLVSFSKFVTLEYYRWNLSLTRSCNAFRQDKLKFRTINLLTLRRIIKILRKIMYKIPVYSNYSGSKYEGFEENVVISVKVGTFIGLLHVVTLSNTINCDIQPVSPLVSNTLAKRKHLHQAFVLHTTSNEVISII